VGNIPEEADEMSVEASTVNSPKTLEAASSFFRILSAKKLDVSRLNTLELLRRDYKENTIRLNDGDFRAGFASVPVGLSDWVHDRHGKDHNRWDSYWSAIRDWMKQRELDVAVVGTSFQEPKEFKEDKVAHKREL
jgi:exopolyphosphatase